MLKHRPELIQRSISELNFNGHTNNQDEQLRLLSQHALNYLRNSNPPTLPVNPAPEKHPYKELLPINPLFTKYIVGTFPPITYLADSFPGLRFSSEKFVSRPQIPFYHGNRQMLWKYLIPSQEYELLSNDRIQRRQEIINFLVENQINYADIINYCQRVEYNANDSNLFNIQLNQDLIDIILNSTHQNLLLVFNTGSMFTSSGITFSNGVLNPKQYVFDMFIYLLITAGVLVEIQVGDQDPVEVTSINSTVLNNFRNILKFKVLVNGRSFNVIAGPSPANGDGTLHVNNIYKRFKRIFDPEDNLNIAESKKQFKTYVYQTALLGNFEELDILNSD